MDNKSKIIAFYLPQYHRIPENDKWWGEGFTEWVNVKKARPLFEGQYQPRIPKDKKYYDLTNIDVMRWQAKIANKYGVYGFCFYHYWFYEKPFMEKPLINYYNNKDINFPYCFCWANESWTNAWAKDDTSVIMEQKYGNQSEWKKHFDFLLPFFKDDRYIKEDNKPLIVIYRPYLSKCMIEILDYWKELAKKNGFSGLNVASQRFEQPEKYRKLFDYMDYHIEYQPDYDRCHIRKRKTFFNKLSNLGHQVLLKTLNWDISFHKNQGPERFDYDEMWRKIIETPPVSDRAIAGAFVDWDNTPRHKYRGSAFTGVTPEKFGYYMKHQLNHMHKDYNNNYLFIFAWNEWGEGGYLEPDEKYGYKYLEALLEAVKEEDKK